MNRAITEDKRFYKSLLAIGLPIAIQNLISSSLNMVDNVMIASLGESNIAAVGFANQFFFIFALLSFGINSGSAIFISQFWGKKDVINIRRIMGVALVLGGSLSLLFTALALLIPEQILGIFTNDTEVISLGMEYLTIVCFSYFINGISFSFGFASRSIGQAKIPMFVSAIALGCNTLLNYTLILGNFGFPALGIKGAAIATLISRAIEVLLLITIIYGKKGVLAGKISEMMSFNTNLFSRFIERAGPVIANEAFWVAGMSAYLAAYGRISTTAVAAVQVSNTINNLFMVVSMGLGNASAVMIGNALGANKRDRAIRYARKFSIIGPIIGIVTGGLLILLSPYILVLFEKTPEVYILAKKILIVMALAMSIRVFNTILVVGILRGGGDTFFGFLLETGSVWLIGVPLAFLGSLVFKLPIYWVIGLVYLEEVVKAIVGIPRLISKRWANNVVDHI